MARKIRAGGGKPPVFKGFKTVGGVKKKVTGKGRLGVGLGMHGKGKKITNKGYTGKGAYGYGQGNHGVTPKKASPGRAGKAPMVVAHSKPPAHGAGTRRAPGGGSPGAIGGKPPVKKPPRTRRPR